MGIIHLSRFALAADRKGPARVVGAAVRPSKRAELAYRAILFRIVGWCEAVGRQRIADLRQHWPVADGLALDAKTPKHGPHLVEQTRIVARKVTDVRNKRGIVRKTLREVDKRLVKSIHAAIGVDISELLDVQSGGAIAVAMEQAAAQNAGLIESIPVQYLGRVQRAVSEAFGAGQRIEALAKTIQEIGDITLRRAKLIARDQTSKMNAAFNQIRQTGAGIKSYVWSTSRDERVRPAHRAMDGSTQQWASPPEVEGERVNPGEAINCFPGDSHVEFAHDVKKAYRRRYSGDLAEIVTASGKTLRATPNHPVLTTRGWLPLGQLDEGDHVIEVADEVIRAAKRGDHDRVPLIADVFEAATGLGAEVSRRSGRVVDFHGDGTDDDVDVVLAARPLVVDHVTARAQGGNQFGLAVPANRIGLQRAALEKVVAALHAANLVVRGAREFLAGLWRQATHAQQLCFADASPLDAGFLQPSPDHDPIDAKSARDRQFAFAGHVGGDNGRDIDRHPVRSMAPGASVGIHAARAQSLRKSILADADDLGGFPERLPFRHQSSRVVKARRFDWAGHVFNLETAAGWYVTEGIVTHNCRCVALPVIEADEVAAEDPADERVAA